MKKNIYIYTFGQKTRTSITIAPDQFWSTKSTNLRLNLDNLVKELSKLLIGICARFPREERPVSEVHR